MADQQTAKTMRARRYPIGVPAEYRFLHETAWITGRVANISRSGLLLEPGESLRIGEELEVRVPLVNLSLGIESTMRCCCTVVRTQDQDGKLAAGARITDYALGNAALGSNEF